MSYYVFSRAAKLYKSLIPSFRAFLWLKGFTQLKLNVAALGVFEKILGTNFSPMCVGDDFCIRTDKEQYKLLKNINIYQLQCCEQHVSVRQVFCRTRWKDQLDKNLLPFNVFHCWRRTSNRGARNKFNIRLLNSIKVLSKYKKYLLNYISVASSYES